MGLVIDLFWMVLVLFIGVPPIYGHLLLCSSFLPISIHLVQRLGFNNIFAVKKKILDDIDILIFITIQCLMTKLIYRI
jgi:hypothetical protein